MNAFRYIASWIAPSRFPDLPDRDLSNLMKAVVIFEHGAPEVMHYVEHFPSPKAKPGTRLVTVDIYAAGVNPLDFKMRQGPIANFLYPKPKVLGVDFAGVVVDAPENSSFSPGQQVFGMLPLLSTAYGSYASRCCVDESALALAPVTPSIPLHHLAAIPLVACTVIQAFRPVVEAYGHDCRGKKCCIAAGSGGVGVFAIQYCANVLGMEVTTFASSENIPLLQSLGASQVYDYHTTVLAEVVQGYDVFFDTLGYLHEDQVFSAGSSVLKHSPANLPIAMKTIVCSHYIRIASSPYTTTATANPSHSMSSDPLGLAIAEARLDRLLWGYLQQLWTRYWPYCGMQYHFVLVSADSLALQEAAQCILQGQIHPVIQQSFPLCEARQAHELLEAGHVTGKLILIVQE